MLTRNDGLSFLWPFDMGAGRNLVFDSREMASRRPPTVPLAYRFEMNMVFTVNFARKLVETLVNGPAGPLKQTLHSPSGFEVLFQASDSLSTWDTLHTFSANVTLPLGKDCVSSERPKLEPTILYRDGAPVVGSDGSYVMTTQEQSRPLVYASKSVFVDRRYYRILPPSLRSYETPSDGHYGWSVQAHFHWVNA